MNYLDPSVESDPDSEQDISVTETDYDSSSSQRHSRSSPMATPTTKSKRCQCPPEFKILIKQLLNESNHNIERLQLFIAEMNLGIHRMCRSDLRNIAKHSISLLNNVTSEEIISRARLAFKHQRCAGPSGPRSKPSGVELLRGPWPVDRLARFKVC